MAVPSSQLAPLPTDLPFRLVSDTIGQGAYAFVRKAVPLNKSSPVLAIKFINKDYAYRRGRLRQNQLRTEITLHKHLGRHHNIIELFHYGDSAGWIWLALELADGGDLFDKIEADVGVGVDIAHFYFFQLISAVAYMHDRGVAHRDLKPENILLSRSGDLKLADFGLAALFHFNGKYRPSTTVCGSPPYIAPEIIGCAATDGYDPSKADLWSCGIILFVLLCGNTPWDEPNPDTSQEYYDYVRSDGRPVDDEMWDRVPADAASLLRKLLAIDPSGRMSLDHVRRHTWFTRPNRHIDAHGRVRDPVALATQMLQSLRINLNAPVRPNLYATVPRRPPPRPARTGPDAGADPYGGYYNTDADADDALFEPRFSLTQPDLPTEAVGPTRPHVPASQPVTANPGSFRTTTKPAPITHQPDSTSQPIDQLLSTNPALSQFSQQGGNNASSSPGFVTLTQQARQFCDLVPAYSLTHFLSIRSPALVVAALQTALHTLGVAVSQQYLDDQFGVHPAAAAAAASTSTSSSTTPAAAAVSAVLSKAVTSKTPILPFVIPVRTTAGRRLQPLRGHIVIEARPGDAETLVFQATQQKRSSTNGPADAANPGRGGNAGAAVAGNPSAGLLEIKFAKSRGDPVEWRRLFKRVVVLAKDVVWMPEW